MLTDKQIWEAWDKTFDTPVDFDHKPTPDEILLVRIKAVLKAVEEVKESYRAIANQSIPIIKEEIKSWCDEDCPHAGYIMGYAVLHKGGCSKCLSELGKPSGTIEG